MSRADLLALTADDLSVLTNRGAVKRVQRELESGEAKFTISESDAGEVVVEWSDGVRCTLPAGKTVTDSRCTCVATSMCRHIVRSVLAYQEHHAAAPAAAEPAPDATTAASTTNSAKSAAVVQPWDPGRITDEQLAAHYKKAAFSAIQSRFAQGILVDLVRSAKPTARFHQLACTLRFLVPDDVRYTHCDCAEPAPCSHVPLAVWAFRLLPPQQSAGFVATQQDDPPVPLELLDQAEALLRELLESGIAAIAPTWKDRLRRLEGRFIAESLIWPWEILSELIHEIERHASHDARFSPEHAAALMGEWLIRADAIRSRTRATPQLLIRGSSSDRPMEITTARYVGLGCGAEVFRGGVTLTAYMQDVNSGSVVTVSRDFDDPPRDSPEAPRPFHRLAETSVVRSLPLVLLGGGQLILQGGKRRADHRIVVGRAKASGTAQAYAWESLRAPVLVEDYAEVRARLGALRPASLRPRYVAENLHVLPVASVLGWQFMESTQTIEATIRDSHEDVALLRHPYFARAGDGAEALLKALADDSQRLVFVAGQVSQSATGLLIQPTMCVFEKSGTRHGVQPWVDRVHSSGESGALRGQNALDASHDDGFRQEMRTRLGELLLLGLNRSDSAIAKAWANLAHHAESIGYDRLVRPVSRLAEEFARKLSNPRWNSASAAQTILHLALLSKLLDDVA